MALPPATAEDASAQETVDGYFSPLASAKYVLLAAFRWGRTPVCSPVRAVVRGDRAYFQTWSTSRTWKRLRHNDWVQVAPCAALGLYRYGPWLGATARLLAGEEASQAARKLARQHPGRHSGLTSLAYRFRGAQPVYYELRPCAGAGARADRPAGGPPGRDHQAGRAQVLAGAGEKVVRIGRPPDAGWGALARGSMVSTSERLSRPAAEEAGTHDLDLRPACCLTVADEL
jgi:uncharacterized protein